MIRLLLLLFLGHAHKWKTDKIVPVKTDGRYVGDRHYQSCEACGKVKKVDLYDRF